MLKFRHKNTNQNILMGSHLHLTSWNATGIMSSASYLSAFLDRNEVHIIGLSEHWLFNHNMHFLESINSEYTGFGIAVNNALWQHRTDQTEEYVY